MFKLKQFALAGVLTLSLVGCGMAIGSNFIRGADSASDQRSIQTLAEGRGKLGFHRGFDGELAAKLALSPDQRDRLRAIGQKAREAHAKPDHKANHEALKAILLADTVDTGALRGFIDTRRKEAAAGATSHAEVLGEMRAVLTDAQRAQLAGLLKSGTFNRKKKGEGNQHKHFEDGINKRVEAVKAELNLTPEQDKAVTALQQKIETLRAEVGPGMKATALAFLETGDKTLLIKQSTDTLQGRFPTDEAVAVANALDKRQREILVAKFEKMRHKKRKHGHHGK